MNRFAVEMALARVVFALPLGVALAQSESAKQSENYTLKARSRTITIIDGDDRLVGQIVPES